MNSLELHNLIPVAIIAACLLPVVYRFKKQASRIRTPKIKSL